MHGNVRNSTVLRTETVPEKSYFFYPNVVNSSIVHYPVQKSVVLSEFAGAPQGSVRSSYIIHDGGCNVNFRPSYRERSMSIPEKRTSQSEISQLKAKISLLESHLIETEDGRLLNCYREENDKLSSLLRIKLEEIDGYKDTVNELKVRITEQDCEIDKMLRNEKKKDEEIQYLRDEFYQLEEESEQKSQEISSFDYQISSLESSNKELKFQIDELRKKIRNYEEDDYESKNIMTETKAENDRLNAILKSKNLELSSFRQKLHDLEIQLSTAQMDSNELKILSEIHSEKLKEIDGLRVKMAKKENALSELMVIESKYKDAEDKITQNAQEISRLKQIVRIKAEEIERCHRERNGVLDEIREKDGLIEELMAEVGVKSRELEISKGKTGKMDQLYKENIEKDAIIIELDNRNSEVQGLYEKALKDLKKVQSALEEMKKKNIEVENKNNDLLYSNEQLLEEAENLKGKIAKLESNNDKGDLEKVIELAVQVERLKEELEITSTKLKGKTRELEKANENIKSLNSENQEIRFREEDGLEMITSLKSTIEGLKSRNERLENGNEGLKGKLEELNTTLSELTVVSEQYERDLSSLKAEKEKLLDELQSSNAKTTHLIESQRTSAEETEKLHVQISELERRLQKLNILNISLESEIKEKRGMLHETLMKCDNLDIQNKKLSDQLQLQKLENFRGVDNLKFERNTHEVLREDIEEKEQLISTLRKSLLSKENAIASLENKINEFKVSLYSLQEEYDKAQKSLKKRNVDNEQLKNQIASLETSNLQYVKEIDTLNSQINNVSILNTNSNSKLARIANENKANSEIIGVMEEELKEKRSLIKELKAQIEKQNQKIIQISRIQAKLEEELEATRNQLSMKTQENSGLEESQRGFETLKEKHSKLETTITEKTEMITSLETEISSLKTSLESEIQKSKSYFLQIQEKEECFIEITTKHKDLSGILKQKEELIMSYESKLALLTQEIERLNSIISTKNSTINELSAEVKDMSEVLEMNQKDKGEFEVLEKSMKEMNLQKMELKNEVEFLQKSLKGQKENVENLNTEISTIREKNSCLSQENIEMHHQLSSQISSYDSLTAKFKVTLAKLVMLSSECEALRQQLNLEARESQKASKELRDTRRTLHDLKSLPSSADGKFNLKGSAQKAKSSFGKENSEIRDFSETSPNRSSVLSEKLN